jgi:hypothetical protein
MKKNLFATSAEVVKSVWNRYGLSEKEWLDLSPEDRVTHYNRNRRRSPNVNMFEWPSDLMWSYSHDPYFHTPQMEPCKRPDVSSKECPCNMCVGKIGIAR